MQPVHPDGVVGGWLWAHLESKGLHDRVKNPQNLLHISMVALSFGRWDTGTQMRLSPTGSQPVRNTVITIEATMNVRNRRPACLSRPSLQRGKTLPKDVSRRR